MDFKNSVVILKNGTHCLLSICPIPTEKRFVKSLCRCVMRKTIRDFAHLWKSSMLIINASVLKTKWSPPLFSANWWYHCSWVHKPLSIIFHSIIFSPQIVCPAINWWLCDIWPCVNTCRNAFLLISWKSDRILTISL